MGAHESVQLKYKEDEKMTEELFEQNEDRGSKIKLMQLSLNNNRRIIWTE